MNKHAQRQEPVTTECIDEKLYRLIVENIKDHAVIALDLNQRIIYWNPGAEKTFGYKKEEIIGKDFATLFTPEDRQKGTPKRELEETKTSGSAGDFHWQLRNDGSLFWASGH